MSSEKALQKRIKRHVVGRVRDYFAITAPGLEKLCRSELTSPPLSLAEAEPVMGGVKFRGKLMDCCAANLHLRTAGRILLRIAEFRASDFGRLERRLREIPWELYLFPNGSLDCRVTTAHSRLYHKEAVAQRVKTVIQKYFADQNAETPDSGTEAASAISQRIYIRGVNDRFTVSIDSSGENLYRRGLKNLGGKAPLRETTAAAILMMGGYDPNAPLLDPMCGSGTFSLEAASIASGTPPGLFRDFAFMEWPSYRREAWNYMKNECRKKITPASRPLIFASDTDETACRRLREIIGRHGLSESIRISQENFFDLVPGEPTGSPGLAVFNPPYGRRMGEREESRRLLRDIFLHLQKKYTGWKFAVISPDRRFANEISFPAKQRRLTHGGLDVTLLTGVIP